MEKLKSYLSVALALGLLTLAGCHGRIQGRNSRIIRGHVYQQKTIRPYKDVEINYNVEWNKN